MKTQIPEQFDFLLQSDAQFKGAHGGRGSAKSHSFAESLVIEARYVPLNKADPHYVGCFREVQNTIRDSVKRLIDAKIDKLGYRRYFTSTDSEIRRIDGGSFFGFYGLRGNADGIKSLENLKRACYEEAQTLSQDSIETAIPTIRGKGSQQWFSWNPKNATDPVDVFLRQQAPPGSVVREVNWYDNPFFPVELRRMMEYDRSRDIDKYNHIWCGQYRQNSEARVFKNYTVRKFVTPAQGCLFLAGADWGFSIDPSVFVRCWVGRWVGDPELGFAVPDTEGDCLFIDYEAYGVGVEIDNTPALFDAVPGARGIECLADSARPETISYMRRHGYPQMKAAAKGKGSVEDGIEFLKNYNIIIHPRCVHTKDEFDFYSWKVDKLTARITNVLEDKKNHVIDAVRYAVEKIRNSKANLWAKFGKKVA